MASFWITENRNYERSCMITCALSGVVANRDQCPGIPYTPEEYAAEAKRAYEAGAAAIHIHARKPDGTPSYEVDDYQNIYNAVRQRFHLKPIDIINLSCISSSTLNHNLII